MLLRKGVYPYEYMDDREKFNETTLSEKEEFYNCLNMEDITDADYLHAKRIFKDFEIKGLGEYRWYIKSDTLLLADVFENFRKVCLNIYHLDSVKFLSAPGISMASSFKNRRSKIRIINWYWYAINGQKRN